MSPDRLMIKAAAENLALEKVALTPTPGGQIPPPPTGGLMPPGPPGGAPPPGAPMDPAMMGGAPPGAMPPGAPPPGDPGMGAPPPGGMPPGGMPPGMPPMDPAAMGGGAPMDPSMMGPPPGGDEPPVNDANNDYDNDGKPDVMVPLNAVTEHTVRVIEATKGKRTADAAPPKDPSAAGAAPMPLGGLGGGGGADAGPMPLPGLSPAKSAADLLGVIEGIKRARKS